MRNLQSYILTYPLLKLCTYAVLVVLGFSSCFNTNQENNEKLDSVANLDEFGDLEDLHQSSESRNSTKFAKILGWKNDEKPIATNGYRVVKFAKDLNSPRNIYIGKNGDIFVAQARTEKENQNAKILNSQNLFRSQSPNQILRFRDKDKDGIAETQEVFLDNLHQPYGMLLIDNYFYVANTDAIIRYPYDPVTEKITGAAQHIIDLPAGGYNNHWTRNLISNHEGSKIYVSVGSGSNVGENGMDKEVNRAAILEMNPDGTQQKIFASGLRNPVGMAFEGYSQTLWTVVNERDELGDKLVPDYLTSVQDKDFYGWPYLYWGHYVDPRWEGKIPHSLSLQARKPDYAIGSHTGSLGLALGQRKGFKNGAYIGQHGSWNRSELVGYKVIFIEFENGKPVGEPQNFLSGFIADKNAGEVYGRPVAVAFTDNYILVTDDAANTIWAVIPE
ncbi:PQQ-dependent sugar dehydrogenase [Sphingobacterium sp. MYb382]|uniref:PQQ-dependent sugar dehydrogenase n=1 Tax=Sphingobacterium sp. MYb382 TaxID=2745278 RepID=UPI0030A999A7